MLKHTEVAMTHVTIANKKILTREEIACLISQQEAVIPFFQPIGRHPSGHQAHECLVRLRDHDGLLLNPGQFLPQIEGTPLMVELDHQILTRAIKQVAEWQELLKVRRYVHVNATVATLRDPGYFLAVYNAVTNAGIDFGQLTVEVVEPESFWHDSDVLNTLSLLRKHGVKLAIDDCPNWLDMKGLVRYLAHTPRGFFEALKLDRSLVRRACADVSGEFYRALQWYIEFAHRHELHVVAEGVESKQELAILIKAGVDMLQGYLLGRPVPAEAVGLEEGVGQ
jgi:EAL domain-containing protein (putative c-di-GMP-specific phosphodiesterase class I)